MAFTISHIIHPMTQENSRKAEYTADIVQAKEFMPVKEKDRNNKIKNTALKANIGIRRILNAEAL